MVTEGTGGVGAEADRLAGEGMAARTPGSAQGLGVTEGARQATSRQIRGSTLFLVGRGVAMVLNFVVQVLIVRYLAKEAYGAFAYALAIVNTGEMLVALGLDQALTRFLSIYDERRDYARLFGSIALALGTILSLGLALVLIVVGLQGWLTGHLVNDAEAVGLLVIMIVLAPIQALDDVVMGLFAVFAEPRSIFVRKYLLEPGLRLAVVLLLVLSHSGVEVLAAGYVAAGALGVGLYGYLLVGLLRRRGLLPHLRLREIRVPAREIFSFTLPLLIANLVFIVLNTSDAILLEHFHGPESVAAWRVVQPAAGLNQLAMSSFTLLYMPVAARLFARQDEEGIEHLYWQTAVWLAVITFPVFAATFALAGPLTVALYGARYASSAPYLALLSFGYYFNAALGFNGLTLRVFGVIRYIVVVSISAVVVNLALNLVLIPRYGPLGAAVGTTATLVAHNLLKQAGLRLSTRISLLAREYRRVYGTVALSVGALALIELTAHPHPLVAVGLVAVASAAVLSVNRHALRIGATFPELLRLPLARRLFGG